MTTAASNGHAKNPLYPRLTIHVGQADRFDKRIVKAVFDGEEIHSDRFDPQDDWKRGKFIEAIVKACPAFRLPTAEDYANYDPCSDTDDPIDVRWVTQKLLTAADDAGPEVSFPMLTAAELNQGEYALDYLVPGLLVAGQPAIIGGGFKAMKTTLAIDLALALATVGCFLGKFRVSRRCRVALFSGESGLPVIQESARRIADAAGWNLSAVEGLFFSEALPQLANARHIGAVERFVEANEIDVVILDPLYLSLTTGGNEASLYAMGALLRPLADLCATTGTTPIVVHHLRKNRVDPHAVPELGDLAFSGIAEFARQWLLLGRREVYQPGTGQHRLWLSAGGSAGHSGCWALDVDEGVYNPDLPRTWQISVTAADEARQDAATREAAVKDQAKADRAAAQLERDRKAIIEALGKLPNHTGTLTDIKSRCGRNTQAFNTAFAALHNDGSIVVADPIIKGRNRQYEAFKLGGANLET